jgi:hypothetical protein
VIHIYGCRFTTVYSVAEKRIKISVIAHKTSDLLLAYSDDLKGFVVHGHTFEELIEKSPAAVREVLEAQGIEVDSVVVEPNDGLELANFIPPSFIAQACLSSRAA